MKPTYESNFIMAVKASLKDEYGYRYELIECHAILDGMRALFRDLKDAQDYEMVVRPIFRKEEL